MHNNMNNLTDAGMKYISNLENLSHLEMGSCFGVTDASIPFLEALPKLNYFFLGIPFDGVHIFRTVTDEGVAQLDSSIKKRQLGLGGKKDVALSEESLKLMNLLREKIVEWSSEL
jgi:hypothetical protein